LPDGLFSNQKSQFGQIFESLILENVDIFYVHLEYFTDIWIFYDLLCSFGTFFVVLVLRTKKNLATLTTSNWPGCRFVIFYCSLDCNFIIDGGGTAPEGLDMAKKFALRHLCKIN
jgi:hypothetical protein